MTQLAFAGVGVDFGATKLFSDVSFTVAPGERWGIVGRTGSGKTTSFRLLTRDLEPTRGGIARAPALRVSLLEQHRDYGTATTVWEAAAGELAELLALEQSLVEQAANLAHDSSPRARSEEHTSELQSPCNLVCRLLLEKKKMKARPSPKCAHHAP